MARPSHISMRSTSGKILASVALLGVTASVAGLGTYGSFTSTTSASETVGTGRVAIALGTAGTPVNRFDLATSALVPGDTTQRAATVSNTGDQALGGVSLSTSSVGTPSKLTTDAVHGLQLAVDACSVPWTETGRAPAYTYTCSGTTTSVVPRRAIIGTDVPLANLVSITPGRIDHLRFTATLPVSADNTFQKLRSTVNFTFTATQRPATNR